MNREGVSKGPLSLRERAGVRVNYPLIPTFSHQGRRGPRSTLRELWTMNSYITLETIKGPSVLDIRDDDHDARLLSLIEGVSRVVDGYCRRHFYVLRTTRLFDGDGSAAVRPPDLVSIDSNGLATDDDRDGVFEMVWGESEYLLHPANADPTGGHDAARPYWSVRASLNRRFPYGCRTVRIAGEWGFWRRLRRVAATVSSAVDDQRSEIVVGALADIQVGHTLQIGDEQVYVRGISARTLGVIRGVNGTNAARHEPGDGISVFEYPAPVSEATLLQSARMWRRFAYPSDPVCELGRDVKELLAPYRRLTI